MKIQNILIGTAGISLLLIFCTMSGMAAENNLIEHEQYTLSLAKVQGFSELDNEGNVVGEWIKLTDLNQEATPEEIDSFLEEVSDYALRMDLSLIADCSQERFKDQMDSGIVKAEGASPEDGFLSKEILKVERHEGYYLVVRQVDHSFYSSTEANVVIFDSGTMLDRDNAKDAVDHAQYFGIEYGLIVDQSEDNREKIMDAAQAVIDAEEERRGDGIIDHLNDLSDPNYDMRICWSILSASRAEMETNDVPVPVPLVG